ncbi:MAG: dephospho-CoA kinase [Candidatus Aminicenantales bacterium]
MLIVALTGGIAAGKSVVARFLEERGCAVHSADQAAHEVMAPGSGAWERLRAHFGPGILNPDRTIDRPRLGAIVFADEAERRFLNSVVHPLVLEKKKEIIARLEKDGKTKIFVSAAALTIEAGYAGLFDRVIVVYCRPEVQAARLMARDGLDRQAALQKIRAQMPQKEKKKQADYLIDTSDTLADTEIRTEMVFRQLLRDYQEKEKKKKASSGI